MIFSCQFVQITRKKESNEWIRHSCLFLKNEQAPVSDHSGNPEMRLAMSLSSADGSIKFYPMTDPWDG